MTFDDAIVWVEQNRKAIIGFSKQFLGCCPYDVEDLISCANQAALSSVFISTEPLAAKFEMTFWAQYKLLIREIVPNPGNHRGSESIPSYLCCEINETFTGNAPPADKSTQAKSESVFWAVRPYLTQKEQKFLTALLGLSKSGYHSMDEAGALIGITEPSAVAMFKRVRSKIARLFSLQIISIDNLSSVTPIRPHNESSPRRQLKTGVQ
jgi:hypothetical protein